MQPAGAPSLYDRLGGVYNIATVVDDFIDHVMNDDRLNKNPAVNEAHHRVSAAGFKFLVTEMVCWAAGGPQQCTGRWLGFRYRSRSRPSWSPSWRAPGTQSWLPPWQRRRPDSNRSSGKAGARLPQTGGAHGTGSSGDGGFP